MTILTLLLTQYKLACALACALACCKTKCVLHELIALPRLSVNSMSLGSFVGKPGGLFEEVNYKMSNQAER